MVERVEWAISATCSERALYTVDDYGIGINITRLGVCAIGALLVCLLSSLFLFSLFLLLFLLLFFPVDNALIHPSSFSYFHTLFFYYTQVSKSGLGPCYRSFLLSTLLFLGKKSWFFIILVLVVFLSAVLLHPSFLNQTFDLFDGSILCNSSYPSLSCCYSAAMYSQHLHQPPRALNEKAGPSKLIACVKEPLSWMARLPCADPTASSRSTQWTWGLICWTSNPWGQIQTRMLRSRINRGRLLRPLCRVMLSLSLLLRLGGKRLL